MANEPEAGADEAFVIDEADLGDVGDYTPEELADENVDWKAKALEAKGIAKRRTTALKKAKDALGKVTPSAKKVETPEPKAGELDYGQKAFLIASGVKGDKETALIQEALKSGTFKDLDSVLASKFIQGQLKELRDEAKAEDATPGESGRGGSPARNTKEYWLNKGEMPPNTPENKKLREEIVNAKISKDKSGSVFSKTPVVGNNQ